MSRREKGDLRSLRRLPKKTPALPNNFATNLIEKELQLESDCSLEVLNELVNLYSQAIEYYEHVQDPKYYDFQDRLHKILVRPEILKLMQSEKKPQAHSTPCSPKRSLKSKKKQTERKRQLMAAELTNRMPSTHQTRRNTSKLVSRHSSNTKRVAGRAVKDFQSQETALERRLASRKQKKINNTYDMLSLPASPLSTSGYFEFDSFSEVGDDELSLTIESDRSGGPKLSKQGLEHKLEEIMEKNFAEKAAKIAEIKVNYESQIREMEGQGGIMNMIVDQMKTQMNEEISKLTQELDAKRKVEIENLKKSWNN
uniref:Uncharacterized protein n=1 Tax=Fabrea salina TaxID=342563 RepID=A0A7S3MRU3_9CILI|mmetsp:Transcript_1413/g.2246  ORF Transcript_1413/g.2246 Transcript_1413/m.2246 type:complete len:312 (+) Transcript_1413:13-948(+)